MITREKTVKQYFCARCNYEIKTKKVTVFSLNKEDRRDSDNGIYSHTYYKENYDHCLCNKCAEDLKAFISQKFPSDESERVAKLERKLKEISEIISGDIEIFATHLSVLNNYAELINEKVNGTPYLKDAKNDMCLIALRQQIKNFLESEDLNNE